MVDRMRLSLYFYIALRAEISHEARYTRAIIYRAVAPIYLFLS